MSEMDLFFMTGSMMPRTSLYAVNVAGKNQIDDTSATTLSPLKDLTERTNEDEHFLNL